MYCWGANGFGQLGNGAIGVPSSTPVLVGGPGGFTAVATGGFHTCGLASGQVSCWGWSEYGEVGDGNVLNHTVGAPSVVGGLQATAITAGAKHSCAMSAAGDAVCWGSNIWGALGNEFQAGGRATPQVVARPR
jgi:alpha-tubulin suppressor-like RCC1 family protein